MFFLAKNEGIALQEILDEAKLFLDKQNLKTDFVNQQLERIIAFYRSIKFQRKKKCAWLIYWESSERTLSNDNIIAILDSRKSDKFVRDFILQHYISKYTSLAEKIYYSSHLKDFPYQVVFEKIQDVPWVGMMTCGHNPFIVARIVKNLTLSISDDGSEMLHWENMPKPIDV